MNKGMTLKDFKRIYSFYDSKGRRSVLVEDVNNYIDLEKAELLQADKWISVHDELPKDFERVLVSFDNDDELHLAYLEKGDWVAHFDSEIQIIPNNYYSVNNIATYNGKASHWQPLPQPPKEK